MRRPAPSNTQRNAPRASPAGARGRTLRTIAALAALFVLPLAAALWLYYGMGWSPAQHVNHGELLPVRALPSVSLPPAGGGPSLANVFARRWALVYVGDGRCNLACGQALDVMRLTQAALNEDTTRVQRVFLATAHCCDEAHPAPRQPGLLVLDASAGSASRLIEFFPGGERDSMIFVVDPLGNLMMRYDARHGPRGLLLDLQRLLRLSNIG